MESTQLPPQPTKPRLERLRGDRAVAGVASGLARYLNVDVAWVRIAFVVAALFGGTGVLMYIIGWIAMPEEGEKESIATDQVRRFPNIGNWIGVALIALAAMIIASNTGLVDGDLIFAAVLVVLGFLLYRGDLGALTRSDDAQPYEQASPPPPPPPPPSPATAPLVDETPTVVTVATAAKQDETVIDDDSSFDEDPFEAPSSYEPPSYEPPPPPDPAFQPRPPKPRETSALGRIGLATLLIVVGIMGVGHSSGWWEPAIRHYVGAAFIVLGAALVLGSVYGRARWLIPVGLIAAPILFGSALLDVPLEGGFGDPRFTPTTGAELDSEYRLVGGGLVLDLTDLQLEPGESYEIDASVVFGSLRIYAPQGIGISLDAEMDGGEIRFNGEPVGQGINQDRSISYDGDGMLVVDAHVGFGELVFDRVAEEVTP